jgi:hypothetical protein
MRALSFGNVLYSALTCLPGRAVSMRRRCSPLVNDCQLDLYWSLGGSPLVVIIYCGNENGTHGYVSGEAKIELA